MREDELSRLGREVGRAVRNVLNSKDFDDLRTSIDSAVRNIGRTPGSQPPPFGQEPFRDSYSPPGPDRSGQWQPGSQQVPPNQGQWQAPPRQNQWQGASQRWQSRNPAGQQPFRPYTPPTMNRQYRATYRAKGPSDTGTLMMVLGIIFTILFSFAIVNTVFQFIGGGLESLAELASLFLLLTGSIVLLCVGKSKRDWIKRFRAYAAKLQGRNFATVKELSEAVGLPEEYVARDLQKMIEKRLFPQGHMDEKKTSIMTDQETYAQYLKTQENLKKRQEEERKEKELWEKDPEAAALHEMLVEGARYREEIRQANDAIPGEIISQKLDRLENVTTKIFEYVEKHPKKQPEIRKFMSYYLPITLKLVGAYRDFDAQPVQGENIISAKKEIEDTLDTINLAFENLLDGLFEDVAMDISTDISVLETMLAQEGLTEEKFGSGEK